jgi:peroxiredoxin Q/BCP
MAKINNLPEFELLNSDGEPVNIRQFKGNGKLVLYFYPENESKICTKEACEFRDRYHIFLECGAKVIGINKALPAGLRSFKKNHSLPFMLLSDPDFKIHKLFGIKNILGFYGRETFLFDEKAMLVYAYNNLLNASKHINNIVNILKKEKSAVN